MKKYKVIIPKGYEVANEYSKLDSNENKLIVIELKPIKKELPKTWEEFLRTNNKCYPTVNHFRIPLKYNEAFEALAKLIELRDHYNDGWKPNEKSNNRYFVYVSHDEISTSSVDHYSRHILTFKTDYLMHTFVDNFRELIETAKPLL